MPTYEYKCMDCGNLFEKFQRITEPALEVCPDCGGTVKRLIGVGAGTIFKGNGFYHTDYKMKSSSEGEQSKQNKETKKSTIKNENT